MKSSKLNGGDFMDFKLENHKHIHFVGMGGSGMSVLAEALYSKGFIVTGSDIKESERVKQLRSLGIKISVPHSLEHMKTADLLCYSSAVSADNAERVYARANDIGEFCRGKLLAEFLKPYKTYAVAGSHGKTTTSAYLAHVLNKLDCKSGLFIGGQLQSESDYGWDNKSFVVETDESDGTFLNFNPYYGIITNIDREHLGHYGSFENLIKAFRAFFNQIKTFPIVCGDDKILNDIVYESRRSCLSYGLQAHNDIWASHIESEADGTSFDVIFKAAFLARVKIPLRGEHNVLNSLAIIALATLLDYDIEHIKKALLGFAGVKRRMEIKAQVDSVTFVDDYAHHPTEIKATLAAAKAYCNSVDRRLVVLFEPHRHSRVRDCYAEFMSCFDEADLLVLTDVYGAAEKGVEAVDINKFFEDLDLAHDIEVQYHANQGMGKWLQNKLDDTDYVLGLGAGNMTTIIEDCAVKFKER